MNPNVERLAKQAVKDAKGAWGPMGWPRLSDCQKEGAIALAVCNIMRSWDTFGEAPRMIEASHPGNIVDAAMRIGLPHLFTNEG